MDLETKRLIETGTIFCGRIIKEDGVVSFERVDPVQIENIPEAERGFATASMGRAVFTIDGAGTIHKCPDILQFIIYFSVARNDESHMDVLSLGRKI